MTRIEAGGRLETAHRVANYCDRVFLFARLTGRVQHNPPADVGGALSVVDATHDAAITERAEIEELLRKIDGYQGQPSVVAALKLLPYVFDR